MNSGTVLLALSGLQSPFAITLLGSLVALLIVAVCLLAMRRPVPGYNPTEVQESAESPVSEAAEPQEDAPEPKRTGTPGFTLPLPSDAIPPTYGATDLGRAAPEPQPPRAAVQPPLPTAEQAIDITRAAVGSHRTDAVPAAFESTMPAGGSAAVAPSKAVETATQNLLVFKSGPRQGETILLDGFSAGMCSIGRSEVPENDVVIRDDMKVSRVQHAIITRESDGCYCVRDNNSANRVYINDQSIDSAPVPLNSGDTMRIGLTEIEYVKVPVARKTTP